MTIKTKKARSQNIIYFISDFTPDPDLGYELKCHLLATPEPYGISTDYVLHDLQLDTAADDSLCMDLRYRHHDDATQVLVISFVFPPESDIFIDYIYLHGGQSDAGNLKFRDRACDSIKAILELILNRQKGEHCSTCANKYKLQLTGKCDDLYERNRCLSAAA